MQGVAAQFAQLEGRLADSEAKAAQALVAIQAWFFLIKGCVATFGGNLADAVSQMSAHTRGGCPIPNPRGGWRRVPKPRGWHPSPHGRTAGAGAGRAVRRSRPGHHGHPSRASARLGTSGWRAGQAYIWQGWAWHEVFLLKEFASVAPFDGDLARFGPLPSAGEGGSSPSGPTATRSSTGSGGVRSDSESA